MVRLVLYGNAAEQQYLPSCRAEDSIYVALQDGDITGHCVFGYEADTVVFRELDTYPPDPSLGDGLVRASVAAAAARMKTYVRIDRDRGFEGLIGPGRLFSGYELPMDSLSGMAICEEQFASED